MTQVICDRCHCTIATVPIRFSAECVPDGQVIGSRISVDLCANCAHNVIGMIRDTLDGFSKRAKDGAK